MLLVQKFLENHTFRQLQEQHGVYIHFSKCGTFWSTNYDQIESKESDMLAQQCRGLILSAIDNRPFTSLDVIPGQTIILSCPFFRFFNAGQGSAANINWNDPNLKVYHKYDGSLISLWYNPFKAQWNVATRSVPEADLLMDNNVYTFRTLFEKVLHDRYNLSFDDLTKSLNKSYTYMFELVSRYNRIVVDYPEPNIILLGIRNLETLEEIRIDSLLPQIEHALSYNLNNLPEIMAWVFTLNPLEHEGVVICDGLFNRIKVKNAAYIAASKIRDSVATSDRNMLELILLEKDDDAVSFLPPDLANNLQSLKLKIQNLIKIYDELYLLAKQKADATNLGDKKTFALLINDIKDLWTAPYFMMFNGKARNMKDFIAKNKRDGVWSSSFLDKMLEVSKKLDISFLNKEEDYVKIN